MNKEEFAKTANARYQKSRQFWRNWRVQAQDDYAFVSGDQWMEDDRRKLEDEERVAITFNYSEKMIDAVVGAEVTNRQEAHYSGRGIEDVPLAELWNNAAVWVREQCGAEDEESDAFRDALICGLGWTWTRLSFDEDLDGKILVERVDPLEMWPDPAASRPGLMDRRWQDRLWWVDEKPVRKQWPDAVFGVEDEGTNAGVVTRGLRYEDDGTEDEFDRHEGQVQIRLHEMFEVEDVYRVSVPDEQGQQKLQEVSSEDFAKIKSELVEGQFIKQRKKVYYRAYFAGDTMLEVKKSPCQEGFCFQAITVKRDRNRNTWYGLTRVMKDPQRWANKWLSQILHIVNSNAKGGLLAELGAFVDPVAAQEEWAQADSITLLNEGGLKKVEQKTPSPYPSGLDKLMGFALSSLPMVTGINLEALGLANREQAGVLEQQRKQAAYGLLAPVFDGQRRYRKAQGRVLLYYIDTYISDGRMIRIGGPESQQFMPLTKAPDAPRYDIVVDQSPNAPDTRQRTWETLESILPNMMKAGIPIPPDMLDYTPLPTALVGKWKAFIGQSQQQDQKMQEELEKLADENNKLKQQEGIKREELQFEKEKISIELQMEQEKMEAQIALERAKAQAQFELESFKQDRQFELEGRRLQHETKMKQSQLDNDFRVKAYAAGANPDKVGKFNISLDTGGLPELLSQFGLATQSVAQQAQQSNDAMVQAVRQLSEALARPRKLALNAAGMPVGSTVN